MKKRLIVSLAAGAIAALPLTVHADWYVNPELNAATGLDSGTTSGIFEGHIGYDFENGIYLQTGPAAVLTEDGEIELGLSGKAGMEGEVLYGEVSFETGHETVVGLKAGAKFRL